VTPGWDERDHDGYRAAWALLAATDSDDGAARDAILGRGWRNDRNALIALILASSLAGALRDLGDDDPARAAHAAIGWSIADEAAAS
jgi:hypothetical protein